MDILLYAKQKLDFWLGRDVDYSIPEAIKPEAFMIRKIAGQRYMTISKAKSLAQHIIYPEQREKNIWHDNVMDKLVKSVEKMFSEGAFFNICIIDEAVKDFDLHATPSVTKALKDLNRIHCLHFDQMSPEVFEAIPRYMTHIFTEGRVPLDEVVREGELKALEDEPDMSESSKLIRELSDLANDALSALTSGTTSQEILDALRSRQRQALDKILEEDH